MSTIRPTILCLALVACGVEAHAQFGLYGAPTMLQLPPIQPAAMPASAEPDAVSAPVAARPAAPYGSRPALVERAGAYVPQDPGYPPPQAMAEPPARSLGAADPAPGSISQLFRESDWGEEGQSQAVCAGPQSACPGADPCAVCYPGWFVSVAALYMGRNEPNRLWTTYETDNNPNQIPTDAHGHWAVGGEITIGRYFCCDPCLPCDPCGGCAGCGASMFGIEATYWGLSDFGGYTSRSIPGGSVSTPLFVSDVEFGGVNGTQYFDGAAEHYVERHNEVHNLEVNFLGSPPAAQAGMAGWDSRRLALGWVLGIRYFRFEDELLFGSLDSGYSWGESGGLYEAYLEDSVYNNLVGGQLGVDAVYPLSPRWRIFAAPKLGIYNNHVEHTFALRRGDGVVAVPTAASGMSGSYPVHSSEDAVAFLSEVDLGIDWQVARHWSLYLGYRVVFATGIALADHQVPAYVVDIPEIADVDTNGDLVLHGAFAGATLRF